MHEYNSSALIYICNLQARLMSYPWASGALIFSSLVMTIPRLAKHKLKEEKKILMGTQNKYTYNEMRSKNHTVFYKV